MRNFYRDTLPAFQQKPPNGYGQKYFQPKAKRRNRNRGKKAVFSPIHQDFYEDATPSTLASQSKTINKWRDSPERTARKNPQGFTFQSLFDQANTIKKMPVVPMSFMPGMPVMPSMPVPQPDQYTTKFTYLKYMNVKRQKKYDIKCFLDEDLNIPVQFESKLIPHTCDNDASSDEDQIRRGVCHMFTSLQESVYREKYDKR